MFLCNFCDEGETSELDGICDECAIGIAREARANDKQEDQQA